LVALVVVLVVRERRARERTLTTAKDECLAAVQHVRESVPAHGFELAAAAERWLLRESQAYAGDILPKDARLALAPRTSIYIRAATADMNPERLPRATADSHLDAFTFCWQREPEERTEKVILKHLLEPAHESTDAPPVVASIYRLQDLTLSLNMLRPEFTDQLVHTQSLPMVQELSRAWAAAKVEQRVLSTHAQLLVAVLDEPKTPGTPVELDGAADHWARVVVIDLVSGAPLLRIRKHLDPSWVTERRRPEYAARLEACRLAFDVRHAYASL
jgi:hypothetical protein